MFFNDVLNSVLKNPFTGFGTSRDPSSYNKISPFSQFSEIELENLYRQSKIIEKAVSIIPYDATNVIPQFEIGENENQDKLKDNIESEIRNLNFLEYCLEAWIRGRLYGSGYLILDINDNNEYNEELDFNRIKGINDILVSDCTEIIPYNVSNRGEFEYYQILDHQYKNSDNNLSLFSYIHKSRVLVFPGKKLFGKMFLRNNGRHDNIISGMYNEFQAWHTSISSASTMMNSHSLFSYKMKGLKSLTQQKDKEGLQQRFQTLMQGMSSLKGLILDAEGEDAQFINRNYSGVSAIISELKENLASASGLPYTLVWGTPTGGAFSESGASDRYEHARNISQEQNLILRPNLNYITEIIISLFKKKNIENWEWYFPSALQLTSKEQAELEKLYAETDQIRQKNGILHPMEIRYSRYGTSELGDNIMIESKYDEELFGNNEPQEKETSQENKEIEELKEPEEKEESETSETNEIQEDKPDFLNGHVLSEWEYNEIAEISQEDKENAIEKFKKNASEKWKKILEAE